MTEHQWVQAVISLLTAIGWPLVVLGIVLIFRKPLIKLLKKLSHIEWGSWKADFERTGKEVRAYTEVATESTEGIGPEAVAAMAKRLDEAIVARADIFANLQQEILAAPVVSPAPARVASPYQLLQPLRDFYADRAKENPLNAILEAYIHLEKWFDAALQSRGIDNWDRNRKLGVPEMSRLAVKYGLLPSFTLSPIDGLSIMRDLAIHQPQSKVTEAEAKEFLLLTDGVIHQLDVEWAKLIEKEDD